MCRKMRLPKPAAPANDSNNSEKPAADNSLAAQARAYRAARAAPSAPAAANAAPAPVAAIPKIEKASEARASAVQPQPQIGSVQPAIVSSISIEPANAATKTAAAVKRSESADGNRIATTPRPAGERVPAIDVAAPSEAVSAPAPVPASQQNATGSGSPPRKNRSTAPAPPASRPARPCSGSYINEDEQAARQLPHLQHRPARRFPSLWRRTHRARLRGRWWPSRRT